MSDRPAREPLGGLLVLIALPAAVLVWSAVIGLGLERRGDPAAVALSASMFVFGPALVLAAAGEPARRLTRLGGMLLVWSIAVYAALPLYFPGERRDAIATGLSLLTADPEGEGVARTISDALPEEPEVAVVQAPRAEPVEAEELPAPTMPLADHEIALPYEGEGRRLSVPVVFEHGGVTRETFMMLDTGATYTTLPLSLLERMGARPAPDAPELTLHTANGDRQARVVLLDRVWLGDQLLEGIALTVCEDCATEEVSGLLGLNVTGGYNLTIDADRREVVFSKRMDFTRRLDIRPFSDLQARFVRYPGGRVEVEMDLENRADRDIAWARARIVCGEQAWQVDLGQVAQRSTASVRRRLPRHTRCESYQISLDDARW